MPHHTSPAPSWPLRIGTGVVAGLVGGLLAGWFRVQPVSEQSEASKDLGPDPLVERVDALEREVALLSRQRTESGSVAVAVPKVNPSHPALSERDPVVFENAVRGVLARWEDERGESRQAERQQQRQGRIRGFVNLVAESLSLSESVRGELEAALTVKTEEYRDAKEAFGRSEQAASLTPRQRREARARLEEKAEAELARSLVELLGTTGFERFQQLAHEERFDWAD